MKTSHLKILTLIATAFAFSGATFKCRTTMKGVDYSGLLNTAASGRTCLSWHSQLTGAAAAEFAYFVADDDIESADNFCRNPNNDDLGPWCNTADSSGQVVKEYCDVPFCAPYQRYNKANCKTTERGREYSGSLNFTLTGRVCQEWGIQKPHAHPFFPLLYPNLKVPNYCGNPEYEDGPWCYTKDPASRFEMCNIPHCNDVVSVASMTETTHKTPTSVLNDGDLESCQILSSQSANDFRFQISTTSRWTQLNVELAFDSDNAQSCGDSHIFAFHSVDSSRSCGPVTLCKLVTLLPDDDTDKKLCRFDCSCPEGCETVTLTIPQQIPGFELCEVATWSWKTMVDLSD